MRSGGFVYALRQLKQPICGRLSTIETAQTTYVREAFNRWDSSNTVCAGSFQPLGRLKHRMCERLSTIGTAQTTDVREAFNHWDDSNSGCAGSFQPLGQLKQPMYGRLSTVGTAQTTDVRRALKHWEHSNNRCVIRTQLLQSFKQPMFEGDSITRKGKTWKNKKNKIENLSTPNLLGLKQDKQSTPLFCYYWRNYHPVPFTYLAEDFKKGHLNIQNQASAVVRKCLIFSVDQLGLEPRTSRLWVCCSNQLSYKSDNK